MGEKLSLLIFYLNAWFREYRPDLPSYNAHCAGSRGECEGESEKERLFSCFSFAAIGISDVLRGSSRVPGAGMRDEPQRTSA